MIELYKTVLIQEFKVQSKNKYESHKLLLEQINDQNSIISKARNLLLTEAIDASDYRLIKTETEEKTRRLEGKLSSVSINHFDVDTMVNKALNAF